MGAAAKTLKDMAQMNVPIYRDFVKLVEILLRETNNLPKSHNRTLGDAIINRSLHCIYLLQKAYDNHDDMPVRLAALKEFDSEFSTVCTYLRVVNELHLLSLKVMSEIFNRTYEITRQFKGWTNKAKKIVCEGAAVTTSAREQLDFEKGVPAHSH